MSVRAIFKNFAGVTVLQGIDLALAPGEIVGILGPNGAGKTTLINCLSGVLRPTDGTIFHDGCDITHLHTGRRARRGIVRTFQNLRLFPSLSAAENVELGLTRLGRLARSEKLRRVRAALSDQDLLTFADRPVCELPYGVQRRVEIARALIGEPDMLLLDEPAAGLGSGECAILAAALTKARADYGCAILVIDHNVPFIAGISDRLVLLAEGQIIRDAEPQALLADPIVASIYLGKEACDAQA